MENIREKIYKLGVKVDVIENNSLVSKNQIINCIDEILYKNKFINKGYNKNESINKLLDIEKLEGDGSRLSLVANWLMENIKSNKVNIIFWHEIIDVMLYPTHYGSDITEVELKNFLEVISIYKNNL